MKETRSNGTQAPWGLSARPTVLRLLGLTALPAGLLAARVLRTGSSVHTYVAWNLVLAWLPLLFAYLSVRPGSAPRLLRAGFGLAWLLFLPNAPYLVTDLMHLHQGEVPILYDVVLLFSAALCGLALGLVSLHWMESGVVRAVGRWPGRLFGAAAACAAGFGVYLGRYLRWNSWDLVTQPAALARDIVQYVAHPVQHWQVWGFALLFAALLLAAYRPVTTFLGAEQQE
jgi:uncharacterized membrane protein